jgi:hypothetical protein
MSMSSKPKRVGSAESPAASTQAATGGVSVGNALSDEEIRLRAYEIYLERGEGAGLELDDWLKARARTRSWGAVARASGLDKETAPSVDTGRNGRRSE